MIRADNGREFFNSDLQVFCRQTGIVHQTSTPHSPHQNGKAERANRTLLEMARAMLAHAYMPSRFWVPAIATSCYLHNRLPSASGQVSPYEILYGITPSLDHCRVFGCLALAKVPYTTASSKWAWKSQECIFLGYSEMKKAYLLLTLHDRKELYSKDVVFNETKFPFALRSPNPTRMIPDLLLNEDMDDTIQLPDPVATTLHSARPVSSSATSVAPGFTHIPASFPFPTSTASSHVAPAQRDPAPMFSDDVIASAPSSSDDRDDVMLPQVHSPDPHIESTADSPPPDSFPSVSASAPRRSTRTSAHPDRYRPSRFPTRHTTAMVTNNAFLTEEKIDPAEPQSYAEALVSPEREHWIEAIDTELSSMDRTCAWTKEVPFDGQKPIDTKWVFKVKRDSDGRVTRYRARLVARGFLQQYGRDFFDTFAPVVARCTWRLLLIVSLSLHLLCHHMDVATAFLIPPLTERVYLRAPKGFRGTLSKGEYLGLLKTIYGLKQSSREWWQLLQQVLCSHGFRISRLDPCLYIGGTVDSPIFITVYVDDLLIFARTPAIIAKVKKFLMEQFKMTDWGVAEWYLGISMKRTSPTTLILSQPLIVRDLLRRVNMVECNPVCTPLDVGCKLVPMDSTVSLSADWDASIGGVSYRSIVGSLLYLASSTRPDLSYAVGMVSRFLNNPGPQHVAAVKHILKYLKGTANYGLRYEAPSCLDAVVYTDADYASSYDRRSISGLAVFIGNNLMMWRSKKQCSVALSTTEAEYVALAEAAKEAKWISHLLQDIFCKPMLSLPITIYEDNAGAKKAAENPTDLGRLKHVEVRYHFVRQEIDAGRVVVRACSSQENLSDIFTKIVPRLPFQYVLWRFGIVQQDPK